jgi:predicted transcriptional regulator
MNFAAELAEDRRLVILRALTEVPGNAMNEAVAQKALAHFGHKVGADIVRADLSFLESHGLVRIEKLDAQRGELWLATLTVSGLDVANGYATHPGVARRLPG